MLEPQDRQRDWERLVAFYAFPKEHWKHLRTTNPMESPFAAVRLRTAAGKGYKKVANATALIWRRRRLKVIYTPIDVTSTKHSSPFGVYVTELFWLLGWLVTVARSRRLDGGRVT